MTRIKGDWLHRPATQQVFDLLEHNGAQAFLVGGCVRNALLKTPVSDIDIATDAHPDDVLRWASAAGVSAVPTGQAHGTVTVLAGGIPHEVTTFRRDVETDGRHAVVAFSRNLAEDAARRDFTMNALYASRDGTVIDPLDSIHDLNARRVRFIGEAADRIAEDYLRSLRYFRFYAWYGDTALGPDPDALAAIASMLEGLDGLSRERVGAEMLTLLAASDPAPAVASMSATGVLAAVLPGASDRALAPLIHLETAADIAPDALRRVAVLGGDAVAERLRLSRAQSSRLDQLRTSATGTRGAAELGYRLGADLARDALLVRFALFEQPFDSTVWAKADVGAAATFPIRATDLMPEFTGAELGAELARREALWIKSGFALSRAELLG